MMPPPPPPVVRTTTVDRGTLEDANAGRVAIMSTALTPPAGTWSFEDWELFLISASYAVSDQFVITATTMVPVTSELYWGVLSGKLQVVKQGNLRVALQGGLIGALESSTSYDAANNATTSKTSTSALELGAAATLCIDPECFSHVDGAVVAGFAHQSDSSVPVGFQAGFVGRISNHVRFVAEADTAHVFGNLSGQANGFLGWYGVRFTSRQIGVDLELVRPFCSSSDCDMKTFPLGFPFVAFSYRGLD